MSASKGPSVASKKAGNSLLLQNTHSATVPGKGNAFCLSHIVDRRHVGDGTVFPMFIWICNNWIGASQSDARQPIRASFSETTEAVYSSMRGASRGVEQTAQQEVEVEVDLGSKQAFQPLGYPSWVQ